MAQKQKTYRVYADDREDYAFGGPLFGPMFVCEYKGRTPEEAIRKYYRYSQKHHLGWRLYDLSARLKRKAKRRKK